MKKKLAILIYGPPREIDLIYKLIPKMCGKIDYDLFIILREVSNKSKNRQGLLEKLFNEVAGSPEGAANQPLLNVTIVGDTNVPSFCMLVFKY